MSAAPAGIEDPVRQQARSLITSLVPSKFGSTLKAESDIVNVFMALIYFESNFQVDVKGVPLGSLGSASKDYFNASAVQAILQGTDPTQKANITDANRAMGLC